MMSCVCFGKAPVEARRFFLLVEDSALLASVLKMEMDLMADHLGAWMSCKNAAKATTILSALSRVVLWSNNSFG